MLHTLRKLKASLGQTLAGLILLTWLGAALQPCLMTGSTATRHMAGQITAHDCCPPGHNHPAPSTTKPHCAAPGCEMQAIDQQNTDLAQWAGSGGLVSLALLLFAIWPRQTRTSVIRIALRAPPPRPHPTLAYCTLLI